MRVLIPLVAAIATIALPVTLRAAVVDANLIPDGRYVVKVERVDDAHHVFVLMPNGMETNLTGRDNVDFSKLKPNDTIQIALIKGIVPVYQLQ